MSLDWRLLEELEWRHALSETSADGRFEELMVAVLSHRGYRNVLRPSSVHTPDEGIDIECFSSEGTKIAVQCKRYSVKPHNREDISKFVGDFNKNYARGIFVTTLTLNKNARAYAAGYPERLQIVDAVVLNEWLQEFSSTGSPNLIPRRVVTGIGRRNSRRIPNSLITTVSIVFFVVLVGPIVVRLGQDALSDAASSVANIVKISLFAVNSATSRIVSGPEAAIAAARSAMSVPTGSGGNADRSSKPMDQTSQNIPSDAPAAVVREFYTALSHRDWAVAYRYGDGDFQRSHPFDTWQSGYESTLLIELEQAQTVGESPPRVAFSVVAADSVRAEATAKVIVRRFSGTWQLSASGSGLLLSAAATASQLLSETNMDAWADAFRSRHGREPGAVDVQDLAWSLVFRERNDRPPNDNEWRIRAFQLGRR